MEKQAQDILKRIQDAIKQFEKRLPSQQQKVLEEITPLLKDFDVKQGRLVNNVDNLRRLAAIERKIESVLTSKEYKSAVQDFLKSYDDIADLNLTYFQTFGDKPKPGSAAKIIREFAIESTVNDLIGAGLKQTLAAPVREIVRQNVVSGGNYAKFTEEVRSFIIGKEDDPGRFVKYAGQIAKDSINQYNAQYHETLATDLQFNWGRYVGSNLETTREFCLHLTKKEWVHRSELPEIIKGNIDGKKVKLSGSTGLPLGMIPGTNAENFKVRRGGYNCGHQFFWVADNSVPVSIRNRFPTLSGTKKEPAPTLPKPKYVPIGDAPSAAIGDIGNGLKKNVSETMTAIDRVHGVGFLQKIPVKSSAMTSSNGSFAWSPNGEMEITISTKGPTRELTLAHEFGHYLDFYAIGGKGSFDTVGGPNTSKLLTAIKNTAEVKRLEQALVDGKITRNGKEVPISEVYKNHIRYLLKPYELFARTYAQFIAVRGNSEVMKKQLENRVKDSEGNTVSYQWTDESFKDIETEFDALFEALGWVSQSKD